MGSVLFLFVNFASAVLGFTHAVTFFPSFYGVPKTTSRFVICQKYLELRKTYTHDAWCEIQEEAVAHFQVSPFSEIKQEMLYSPS